MKLKRIIALAVCCLLLACCLPLSAVAESADKTPTDSYTHWDRANNKKLVNARPVYEASTVIDGRSIGLSEQFEKIADIDCDDQGNLYILTSDGHLYAVDAQYQFKKEFTLTDAKGETLDFAGSEGLYTPSENEIFIADKMNHRVICCDGEGKVSKIIERPNSPIIPEDFAFSPIKIERDSKGFLYVVSDGGYYGALMFDPSYEFTGFYGANAVSATALDTLGYLWDALTKNDEKRARSVKTLPFQFVDLHIDDGDFVYTVTGRTNSGTSTGQVKMLSPSGSPILYKRGYANRSSAGGFNFGETDNVKRQNVAVVQNFVGIKSDERGYIYALDATYGIVYVYDTDCNLIGTFGGGRTGGTQAGTFSGACALAYSNKRVIVADNILNTVTVFDRTPFGDLLMSAQQKTLNADYVGAKAEWHEVLRLDQNNRLANRGLAKAALREEDYELAAEYAKTGFDFVTYGQALEKTHSAFLTANFAWIFLGAIVLIGAIAALLVITVRRKVVVFKNEEVRLLFNSVIHPFDTFNAIRYKGKGSLLIAIIMALLYYVSTIIVETCSNFRFTSFDPATTSSVFMFIRTVGLILLWAIANWLICVLIEGKGRLREIFITTAYATLPLIVYNLLATVLSHVITSPDNTFLNGLSIVAVILTGIVLTVGSMVVHEFSFPKFLVSVLLTLFSMLLIVFILFMIGMLVSQLWSFVVTVLMEAIYR